jgi:hypothetical protein
LTLDVTGIESFDQVQSKSIRKRNNYLAHLPLHSPIRTVEIAMKSIVTPETFKQFRRKLSERESRRKKEKEQRERERKIEESKSILSHPMFQSDLYAFTSDSYLTKPTASDFIPLECSEDISSSLLSGSSVFLMLISTTLAPAVTEEILHRGIIFRGLKNSFRSRPLIMALTGILFGVFHISPVRWSMPILMGVIAAWIMLETDNIFYTMLLHFLYNSLLIGASLLARSMVPVDSAKLLNSVHLTGSTVGVVLCMYGLPVPLLIYTGCWLIRRSESVVKPAFLVQGRERKTLLQIIIPTVIILCVGLMLIFTDAVIG